MLTEKDKGEAAHRMTFDELVSLLENIFIKHGTSPAVAQCLADNCARAERDGAKSHGIFRISGYVSTLKSGYVDGKAVPVIESAAPGFLRVDGRNGFAQPALAAAKQDLLAAARANGVAITAIRDCHHFGALWLDVEPFADAGFIAISCVNSVARMVPHGGRTPVFGTNPIAFAAPQKGVFPLVFDQATSSLAFGEVRLAALHGNELPPGCGVDKDGIATTDPSRIVNGGSLLPFGGYKGSSIAMMVELLSAALTGGSFSSEVSTAGMTGAQTSKTGQFLMLIDTRHSKDASFSGQAARLADIMRASGQSRLPGDRRFQNRAQSEVDGILMDQAAFNSLRQFQ